MTFFMTFLGYIVTIVVVSILFHRFIRQYNRQIYVVTVIITILAMLFSKFDAFEFIIDGYLGLACLTVMMYVGVLSKKDEYTKRLWRVRTELSIIGFILISAHAQHELPIRFHKLDSLTGVIVYLIMVPLFITSFKQMKKKLGRRWKDLHKLSYLVYLIIFIHLYFASSFNHRITYFIVFGVYTMTKLYQLHKKKIGK